MENKMNLRISMLLIPLIAILFIGLACEAPAAKTNEEQAERVVPVEVMEVKAKSVEQTVELTSTLKPVNTVNIIAEVSGEVTQINKNIGDRVSITTLIAQIDDVIPLSQYEQAKSQVLSAENNYEIAKTNLASDKILFENKDISKLAYDNSVLAVKSAEAQHLSALAALSVAKKSYDDTKVKSPINGIISRKFIELGSMASIGNPLFRVVNISTLKAEVSVPQEYVNRIKVGSKAFVSVNAVSGENFKGTIKRISPQADEVTGGYMVEIYLQNDSDLSLKAGMTAKIEVVLNSLENQVVVPEYSILAKDQKNYVYTLNGDRAQLTQVELGATLGGQTVIESGLTIGDKIVVVGMKNLGVNTKVTIDGSAN
jgi:RND family efflux transporter MFP subunit